LDMATQSIRFSIRTMLLVTTVGAAAASIVRMIPVVALIDAAMTRAPGLTVVLALFAAWVSAGLCAGVILCAAMRWRRGRR